MAQEIIDLRDKTLYEVPAKVRQVITHNAEDAEARLALIEGASQRTVSTASPSAILTTDGTILFDSAAAKISISLPLASVGKVKIPFKDIGCNSSNQNITINRTGSNTLTDSAKNQTSTTIASNGFSGYFLSNGVDTWNLF